MTAAPRRIGVLGGSFNPAHAGHRHISLMALKRLALDVVWWMVSPQNPLKDRDGMASFERRMAAARAVADHPRIRVTDIEARIGTVHTCETMAALAARFRASRFVWLMGADNLAQIHRWKHWEGLFERVPIAVFPRPSYSLKALTGVAAQRFARARVSAARARRLVDLDPPAWVFVHGPAHGASATAIRARRNGA